MNDGEQLVVLRNPFETSHLATAHCNNSLEQFGLGRYLGCSVEHLTLEKLPSMYLRTSKGLRKSVTVSFLILRILQCIILLGC